MAIVKWDPFGDIENFFEDDDFFAPTFPKITSDFAVDVYEKEGNVVVEMQVPGIDPKDINVSVEEGYLRVSGSRKEEKEEKKKHYYRKEIRKGAFERVVALPAEVVGEKAQAEHKDGLLKVIIPKAKKTPKAKKIAVKAKK